MQVQFLAGPAAVEDSGGLTDALAGTPWSVRRGRGPGTRPALEIWDGDSVADIIVATPVASQILRGARRTRGNGPALAVAWGRLPAGRHVLGVAFSGGLPPRRTAPAEVIDVAGLAWFALAAGRFSAVSVGWRGGSERLRLRAVSPG